MGRFEYIRSEFEKIGVEFIKFDRCYLIRDNSPAKHAPLGTETSVKRLRDAATVLIAKREEHKRKLGELEND